MTTTVHKQVLINARALIADPARWTQRMYASTASGQKVAWYDPSAAKWCAVGALYRAAYDLLGDAKEATRIGNAAAKCIRPRCRFRGGLPAMNDTQGHAAVLAAFDEALEVT
jgi:hypothetical protein